MFPYHLFLQLLVLLCRRGWLNHQQFNLLVEFFIFFLKIFQVIEYLSNLTVALWTGFSWNTFILKKFTILPYFYIKHVLTGSFLSRSYMNLVVKHQRENEPIRQSMHLFQRIIHLRHMLDHHGRQIKWLVLIKDLHHC